MSGPALQERQPDQASTRAVVADFNALLRTVTPRVWAVLGIIAVNLAVFGLMVARGVSAFDPSAKDVLAWGADYGPKTLNGEPWRLLVSLFLRRSVYGVARPTVPPCAAGTHRHP